MPDRLPFVRSRPSFAHAAAVSLALMALAAAALTGCKKESEASAQKGDGADKAKAKSASDDEAASKKKKRHHKKGCSADNDCKGARVCVKGECVDPKVDEKPRAEAKPEEREEPEEAEEVEESDQEASQVPAPTPTVAPAKQVEPRALYGSEKVELGKILLRFDVDYKQSFRLTLNDFGEVYFAPTTFKENSENGYLIVQGAKVVYVMPKDPSVALYTRDSVEAVSFSALDSDGYLDVIVIANYLTGAGQVQIPFPVVQIWRSNGPKSFFFDAANSKGANDKDLRTIAAVRKFMSAP